MVSTSASHMIFFIASLVIASSVGITVVDQANPVGAALSERGHDVSHDTRTAITVISDPSCQIYNRDNDDNITLHVKNVGTRRLPAHDGIVDVFVDGEPQTAVEVIPLDHPDWPENGVIKLEISMPNLAADDHRVKVVVEDASAAFSFSTVGDMQKRGCS